MFWIKLLIKNVMQFYAKFRVFDGSGPRVRPLDMNAHFEDMFTKRN